MDFLIILNGLLIVLRGSLGAVFATLAVYSIQQDEWFTAGLCFLVAALVLAPPKYDPAVLWKVRQEGWRS